MITTKNDKFIQLVKIMRRQCIIWLFVVLLITPFNSVGYAISKEIVGLYIILPEPADEYEPWLSEIVNESNELIVDIPDMFRQKYGRYREDLKKDYHFESIDIVNLSKNIPSIKRIKAKESSVRAIFTESDYKELQKKYQLFIICELRVYPHNKKLIFRWVFIDLAAKDKEPLAGKLIHISNEGDLYDYVKDKIEKSRFINDFFYRFLELSKKIIVTSCFYHNQDPRDDRFEKLTDLQAVMPHLIYQELKSHPKTGHNDIFLEPSPEYCDEQTNDDTYFSNIMNKYNAHYLIACLQHLDESQDSIRFNIRFYTIIGDRKKFMDEFKYDFSDAGIEVLAELYARYLIIDLIQKYPQISSN